MPKVKFTEELKLQAVQDYIDNKLPASKVAEKYFISKGDLQKWVDAFLQHGCEGLLIRQKSHRKYDGDFKKSVVEYMHTHHFSARQTAAHFNIPSYTSVCMWEQKYLKEGPEALFSENRGRNSTMPKKPRSSKKDSIPQTQKELIAELEFLRMENEYLKKLNALVQERENSANSTK